MKDWDIIFLAVLQPSQMPILSNILDINTIKKPRVFVSYYHSEDRSYYDEFASRFADNYEMIQDRSVDRVIDSRDPEYVMQRVRDKYITGTSCTVVLCGPNTYKRKYVDWEIKATLDKQHGLIGILLPNNAPNINGIYNYPERLNANISSGYAILIRWGHLFQFPDILSRSIELANNQSKYLMQNTNRLMTRNL